MDKRFKFKNGDEVIIGMRIQSDVWETWVVSCWDNDYNLIWAADFKNEDEALKLFNHLKENCK